ncbi:hypothetical protein [Saccharothrix obliqua]|uniref:hypothetical protein n=1 Tax=Saccharothrix obliqua TaxID=2861747 RepID=UPI001C5D45E6|nr:hypothetical protein [Saccharothrix obliqua]MBW4716104.1 hypothetical protein [Saccharothrix obliqua]
MFLRWRSSRRGSVTVCACTPEWPGLRSEMGGHELRGVPSPGGSSPLVWQLGLVATCTGCGARYPDGWAPAPRD